MTLPCFTKKDIPKGYDIYVIGSDQVWNPEITDGMDDVYTGGFRKDIYSRTIGYAISGKCKTIESMPVIELKRISSHFDAISFREDELGEAFANKSMKEYNIVLDPVLLTDSKMWDSMVNTSMKNDNYVLLYQVRLPKDKDFLKRKALILAERLNCKLIDLSEGNYSVKDFVSLFKYARYVITSSFHATAFSLVFRRPLFAVNLEDGHDSRYKDLLCRIGGQAMSVNMDFDPKPVELDYISIAHNIDDLKQKSITFLRNSVST